MTDLQTPLRVTSAPEYTSNRNVLQANGVFLFRAPTEEIAAEIVRRCNEYEALQSQLLAQEAAVADAWNAEREELQKRLAEVKEIVRKWQWRDDQSAVASMIAITDLVKEPTNAE